MHAIQKLEDTRFFEHLKIINSNDEQEFNKWKTTLEKELPSFWTSFLDK